MLQGSSHPRSVGAHATSEKIISSSQGRLQVEIIWDLYISEEAASQISGWTISLLLSDSVTHLTANISYAIKIKALLTLELFITQFTGF
jgi:hypothetical protein